MRSKSGQPDYSSGIILLCNKQLSKVPDDIPDSSIYLDFSSNRIKNPTFSKDYLNLISLHLNENPLSKLNNIQFENLRSLSLDFCNLTTMKQIPPLPKLISLSLVGNSLSSFEYFHIFPNLTKIDLRGNSASFSPIHTISAVYSLRLTTINGKSVTEQEFQTAFSLSPIVGHALRKGRDPNPQSDEESASLSFLSKEKPLDIKNIGGCLVIRCPVEEASNVKWYQSSSNEFEWELLDCTARTLPVTPMMFQRLIKCEYGSKSFYTADVIQKDGSQRNCFSFTDQPAIIGSGTVGLILSINGQQTFPTKINWRLANSSDSIGSCPVLIVPPEARGQKILAEIFPFSPAFEKVAFEPLITEIQISNVQETELIRLEIPDTIIEDEPFEIEYETYPANAKLRFTIDAANSFESSYATIANLKGKTVFTPTSSEVGKFLRVTTIVGERQYCAYSKFPVEKVKATLKRSLICGENKTNHPRMFLFEFSDGVEVAGSSQKWFVQDGVSKEFISEDKIVVPSDDCAEFTLGVEVTVWFSEDEKLRKEQTFVILCDSPLEKAEKLIDVPGLKDPVEDSKIAMAHLGQWLISDIHARGGFRAVIESEIYTPKASDIGKYIRFTSDMTDVIIGPVLPSQSPIKSINLKVVSGNESRIDNGSTDNLTEINGYLTVGSIVHAQLNFYQDKGELPSKDLKIKWIRCSRASSDKVVQEGGDEYIITYEDHGNKIKARVESTDWQKDSDLTPIIKRGDYYGQIIRGKPAIGSILTVQFNNSSNSTNSNNSYHSGSDSFSDQKVIRWFHSDEPACIAEGPTFTVKFIDINHRIRVEVNGKYNELTETVQPINVEEGQVIKFGDVFHRELTGKTGVLWFRYVFEESEWKEISAKRSYKLKKVDINSVIRVVSYQIHNDGTKTSEIFADIGPITAKPDEEHDDNSKQNHSNDESAGNYDENNEEEAEGISEEDPSKPNETNSINNTEAKHERKAKVSYDYDDEEDEDDKAANKAKNEKKKEKKINKKKSSKEPDVNNFDEYEIEYYDDDDYSESIKSDHEANPQENPENKPKEENENNNEEEEIREAQLQTTKYGQLAIVGDFDENEDVNFFWRLWRGTHFEEIKDTNTRKLIPCDSMVGCHIDGGFQTSSSPNIVWSNKVFIDHALPAPEATLIENGPLVPGCILECRTDLQLRYNPREQLLKLKQKIDKKKNKKSASRKGSDDEENSEKEYDYNFEIDETDLGEYQTLRIKFVWKRWDGMQFSKISNNSSIYKVTEEDTECFVCCDLYYIDKDGNHGPQTSVETHEPISSESVMIEGEAVVGKILNAAGYDNFMKNCHFSWQRRESNNNNNDDDEDQNWVVVGKKSLYRCSCDDIGKLVRVVCETKDEKRISNEIGPVLMNDKVEAKVKEIVKSGSFKFKTKEQNGAKWIIVASAQNLSMSNKKAASPRSSSWKNIEVKASCSSEKKIEIFIGSLKFPVVPILPRSDIDPGLDRDICILALRTFKERALQRKK